MMKTKVTLDLWGMITAWCLYLNGHTLIAMIVAAAVTAMMLAGEDEVSLRRIIAVSIAFYAVMFSFYIRSSVPYFFPGLHFFLAVQTVNASLISEYLYHLDRDYVLAILSITAIAMAALFGLIMLANDADYSLFTKGNLFLMGLFIFLPYFIPCACCCIHQAIKPVRYRKGAVD